jgi:tRNA(Leu) C34 or U34 (ribose-2'-O)-methylase TrmL
MNAVVLMNPKFTHNVGAAIRACSVFDVDALRWTGSRVHEALDEKGGRIPREERMRDYASVEWEWHPSSHDVLDDFVVMGLTPVALEVTDNAIDLPFFEHPDEAVYVFGPEDGGLDRGIKTACHRFVTIPSKHCLNLGAAINVTLYARRAQAMARAMLVP